MLLQPGTAAPDFELAATPTTTLRLRDLRGQRVILAFYPADWSPVCGDEMALYNQTLSLFEPYQARLLGISVDSQWCHQAFAESRHIHFPLLADFEPKGQVSRAYGAYDEAGGYSQRALFVLDEAGIIRWSYLSPEDQNPGADGILDALDALPPAQQPQALERV